MPPYGYNDPDEAPSPREQLDRGTRSFMPGNVQPQQGEDSPAPAPAPAPVPRQVSPEELEKLRRQAHAIVQGNSLSHLNPWSPVDPNTSTKDALAQMISKSLMGMRAGAPMAGPPQLAAPTEAPSIMGRMPSIPSSEGLQSATNPLPVRPGQGIEVPANTNVGGAASIQGPMKDSTTQTLRELGLLNRPLDVLSQDFIIGKPANNNPPLNLQDFVKAIELDHPNTGPSAIQGGSPSQSLTGQGPAPFMNSQGMKQIYPEIESAGAGGQSRENITKLQAMLKALNGAGNENTQFGPGNPLE